MASDMMVALGSACAQGGSLFGLNLYGRPDQDLSLQVIPGRQYHQDKLRPVCLGDLPAVHQTATVLGVQTSGFWGFNHGLNSHQVAIGMTGWHSRLADREALLSGSDLVRLTLERSHSAQHATDVMTDLIRRFGQRGEQANDAPDHLFLVADPREAFVVEAAGSHSAILECRQTRVVTDVALIRQDWQRLSPGLSEHVIHQKWWHDDGSKIDFAGSLEEHAATHAPARRRWGRASVALAQRGAAINLAFLRHFLQEHYVTNRPLLGSIENRLLGSFLTSLRPEQSMGLAWCTFGSGPIALSFPIWLEADLSAIFQGDVATLPRRIQQLTEAELENSMAWERLQHVFDQEADEFLLDIATCQDPDERRIRATMLLRRHIQLFEEESVALQCSSKVSTVVESRRA